MKPRPLTLLLAILLCYFVSPLKAQQFRYTNTVFPASSVDAGIVYGTAPFLNPLYFNEQNTSTQNLVLDLYRPVGDANTNRPAIIFAHSGGFLTGNRQHDDMVAACDSFARRGYVTATIDYRQGFYPLANADLHGTRAVYRGIQDGRAAVRYLRANATAFGIDPNQIYLAGSSAGSFISLHSIYMEENSEKPAFAGPVSYLEIIPPFFFSGPDLGGIDVGNNLGVSGAPNAIVAWWGALQSQDLILPADNEGVFLAHGTEDPTVPFVSGPPFGLPTFPDVDGSQLINARLESLGLTNKETFFVDGAGHEFHGTDNGTWANGSGGNELWDTLVRRTGLFLWQQHKPTADFSYVENGLTLNFTDESSGAISWQWDFGDGASSNLADPTHTFATEQNYTVSLYVENSNLSWDTISYQVSPLAPLPVVWSDPLRVKYEGEQVVLHWSVAAQSGNAWFLVEHQLPDGSFTEIAKVAGEGTSSREIVYTAKHVDPPAGWQTYRIRQLDYDGRYSFSNLAGVRVEKSRQGWTVYPNPSNGLITVSTNGSGEQLGVLKLFDAYGRLVRSWTVRSNQTNLELGDLPPGWYVLRTEARTDAKRLRVE